MQAFAVHPNIELVLNEMLWIYMFWSKKHFPDRHLANTVQKETFGRPSRVGFIILSILLISVQY